MLVQLTGPILVGSLALTQAQGPAPPPDTPPQTASGVRVTGLFASSATNPYESLFIVPAQRPGAQGSVAPVPARNSGSRMRCGMRVVVADPSIDPKFVMKREGVNPDPKMVIPLPPCAEDKR